jgi:hypothetical protein
METAPPVCLLANCFTPEGKPVKENKYISILFFWLAGLSNRKILRPEDELLLAFDVDTFEFLKKSLTFTLLIKQLPVKPNIRTYPRPSSFFEGTMERYRVPISSYKSEILFYFDIDILLLKPLHLLTERMEPATIYLHAEGPLNHFWYNFGFPEYLQPICKEGFSGFSSGKFAVHGKVQAALLFHGIQKCYDVIREEARPDYLRLGDQPLFNQAIYKWLLLKTKVFNINRTLFSKPLLSINRIPENKGECFCIDLMGEPGNEEMHIDKVMHFYPMLLAGCLD